MPIIVGDKEGIIAKAFSQASEEAHRKEKWRKKANTEVIAICEDCGAKIHPKDELWYAKRKNHLCKNCKGKYKSAKQAHVVLSGFSFGDVMKRLPNSPSHRHSRIEREEVEEFAISKEE